MAKVDQSVGKTNEHAIVFFLLLQMPNISKIPDFTQSGMKEEMVVLYLHALHSNGNKRAECNFENNSWDRQGHLGRKISISLEREPQIWPE